MGERERVRKWDGRSLALGLARAVPTALGTFALGVGLRFALAPVLRDFGRAGLTPGFTTLGVVAAVLGLGVGWARMRSTRRIVATGAATDLKPGTRALAIARNDHGSGSARRGPGPSEPVALQRWSADLLTRRDLHADAGAEVTS